MKRRVTPSCLTIRQHFYQALSEQVVFEYISIVCHLHVPLYVKVLSQMQNFISVGVFDIIYESWLFSSSQIKSCRALTEATHKQEARVICSWCALTRCLFWVTAHFK